VPQALAFFISGVRRLICLSCSAVYLVASRHLFGIGVRSINRDSVRFPSSSGNDMKNEQGVRQLHMAGWYALMKYLLVPPAITEKCIYNRGLVVDIDRMTLLHPAIRAA
jgi:hypothetical protein